MPLVKRQKFQGPPPIQRALTPEEIEAHRVRVEMSDPENKGPTITKMLSNFEEAIKVFSDDLVKNGLDAFVTKEQFEARLIEGCRTCPGDYWREKARFGLGKCLHNECGCTKTKLWLASMKCPINHWPEQRNAQS